MRRAGRAFSVLFCALTLTQPAYADYLVNGAPPPSPSPEVSQALAGRAWSVGTGLVGVSASATSPMYLSALLTNPAGSGCTAVVTLRRFSNTSSSTLSFTTYRGSTALSGSTTSAAGNRYGGQAPSSGLSLSYATSSAGFNTGTAGIASPLYAAADKEIDAVDVLPPGTSLGVQIGGLSGLLTTSVTVAVTFSGYCA